MKSLEKKEFYNTNLGTAYLGDSLELMKDIPDASIDLILTSPPFALTRQRNMAINKNRNM